MYILFVMQCSKHSCKPCKNAWFVGNSWYFGQRQCFYKHLTITNTHRNHYKHHTFVIHQQWMKMWLFETLHKQNLFTGSCIIIMANTGQVTNYQTKIHVLINENKQTSHFTIKQVLCKGMFSKWLYILFSMKYSRHSWGPCKNAWFSVNAW